MKTKIKILITTLFLLPLYSFAKSQSGIYASLSDYRSNKLTYETACVKGEKIHLHDFFWNMATITIFDAGRKFTFKKDELYGFRDCDNNVYRFYNNMEYRIAETGYVYIYIRKESTAQNKNNKVINMYYFSATPDGEILSLTFNNLKRAYRDNDKCSDLIDSFLSPDNVCAYDSVHNMFKVNHVFSKAISSNN